MIPTRLGQRVDNFTFVGFLPISKSTLRVVFCKSLVRTSTSRVSAISTTSMIDGKTSSQSLLLFKKDLANLLSQFPGCRLPSFYESILVAQTMYLPAAKLIKSEHIKILTDTRGYSLIGSTIPLTTIFPVYSIFTATVVSNRIQVVRIVEKQHLKVTGSPAKSWVPVIKSFDISFEESVNVN